MTLDVLPVRTGNAAENMAIDCLLLQRYTRSDAARFRHYEWRGPAWTFGYSQAFEWVRAQLPAEARDMCRRLTGGGIVDHTDDWTYALVVPRSHPLYEARAVDSYRAVHECLCEALGGQGVSAAVKRVCEPAAVGTACGPSGVCFQRGELFDVIAGDGQKIAGAAQKRAKHGMLLQGSIARPACGDVAVDWAQFEEAFVARLAMLLGVSVERPGWPEWDCEEESALAESYSMAEWNERR